MILVARIGVESTIAHCVAHNLILDPKFNLKEYIGMCRLMLEDALIPEYLIDDILDEAETQGVMESMMPIGDNFVDGASSISPMYNPRILGAIMKLQNSLEGEK